MTIEPITDTISLVHGKDGGRFPSSHSILVRGKETVLIDTGCGIATLQKLNDEFDIDYVINSHCHPDHSAGNWVFADRPLYAPIESAESHGRLEALSVRLAEPGELAEQWKRFVRDALGFNEMAPTHFYRDGDRFDFGPCGLLAVHTPGHTADHYCLFEPDQQILFSFDLDMTPFGPWYGHRESDLNQIRESLNRIRSLNPKMIVSSHRDVLTSDIAETIDRFEGVLDRREKRLLSMLTRPYTLPELVAQAPFYGKHPYLPDLLKYWEGQMVQKHLDEMVDKRLITSEDGRYCRIA